jgi:hypothetical protein
MTDQKKIITEQLLVDSPKNPYHLTTVEKPVYGSRTWGLPVNVTEPPQKYLYNASGRWIQYDPSIQEYKGVEAPKHWCYRD